MAIIEDSTGLIDGNHVQLDRWEEATGELEAITETEGRVVVELSVGTMSYPSHSVEADRLQEAFTGMEGRAVVSFGPTRLNTHWLSRSNSG